MKWGDLRSPVKYFLVGVYSLGAFLAALCFRDSSVFDGQWFALTVAAVFVATVNVRLPRATSAIISMGDVLTILALIHFGPGAALITYWVQISAGHVSDQIRNYGWNFLRETNWYKFAFNLAQCALSMCTMYIALEAVSSLNLPDPTAQVFKLGAVATSWFVVNTVTLSIAIGLLTNTSVWATWKNGVGLYVLNFYGSAAAAGLLSLFYERSILAFLLTLPIAAVFYQLYRFYIDKYENAQAHIAELHKLYLQTVEALATAVDAKDRYTHGHIRRVQAYGVELARKMGLTDENELMAMRSGALLHDIGKIAIPEYILNKPTVLTESEFEKMKIHPSVGATMLKGIEFPFPVEPLVKSHHERWDGNGYPEGLKGDEIPLNARILSLVDCYDALTTNRPYRTPMARDEVIEFFRRESGRAYDPAVVDAFIANIESLETEGQKVEIPDTDIWGGTPAEQTANVRPLEKVQPTVTYSKALEVGADVQMELYSIFEFVRSARSLRRKDILTFIGMKLESLIPFDAAVFYMADLRKGVVEAAHVVGPQAGDIDRTIELPLDQKLSGWVAANNQALCNLPPFPDFRNFEPKPQFALSAIAPLNHRGIVLGSLALYRVEKTKFSDQEFRHLEIVAGQTAAALHGAAGREGSSAALFDEVTGLPNGYQIYLMFDQIAVDAQRYDYPLSLIAFRIEELSEIRKRYGHLSANEIVRFVARHLKGQVRDSDVLVRYADDQFLSIHPKMSRDQAEALKSRVQNELDRKNFAVRHGTEVAPRISIGLAEFPQEGTKLQDLLSIAEWRLTDDERVRSLARRTVHFPTRS